jgi:hypothetical protein
MITGPDGDSSMSRLVFNLKEDAGGSIIVWEPLFTAAKAGSKTNAPLFFKITAPSSAQLRESLKKPKLCAYISLKHLLTQRVKAFPPKLESSN